jgi:hypothetical protein
MTGTFYVVIDFGQAVSGFQRSELKVIHALVEDNTLITEWSRESGARYVATITPKEDGGLTFRVNANVAQAQDGGQGNIKSVPQTVIVFLDDDPPEIVEPLPWIEVPSEKQTGPFPVTVVFNEPVYGFTQADLTVTWRTAGNYDPETHRMPGGNIASITNWFAHPGGMRYTAGIMASWYSTSLMV